MEKIRQLNITDEIKDDALKILDLLDTDDLEAIKLGLVCTIDLLRRAGICLETDWICSNLGGLYYFSTALNNEYLDLLAGRMHYSPNTRKFFYLYECVSVIAGKCQKKIEIYDGSED